MERTLAQIKRHKPAPTINFHQQQQQPLETWFKQQQQSAQLPHQSESQIDNSAYNYNDYNPVQPDPAAQMHYEQERPDPAAQMHYEQERPDPAAQMHYEQERPDPAAQMHYEQERPDQAAHMHYEQERPDPTAQMHYEQERPDPAAHMLYEEEQPDPAAHMPSEPEHVQSQPFTGHQPPTPYIPQPRITSDSGIPAELLEFIEPQSKTGTRHYTPSLISPLKAPTLPSADSSRAEPQR